MTFGNKIIGRTWTKSKAQEIVFNDPRFLAYQWVELSADEFLDLPFGAPMVDGYYQIVQLGE